jgi:cytochrome oxidase Cu insertion factor (SCO1/SenC/PrrC family)/ABC-type Zn2+ transport system substrate-binding protein/surface adhesin
VKRQTKFALLLMFSALCQSAVAQQSPQVVVSIKPVHSLVAGIMQGVAEPLLLMDGSVAPWQHQPDQHQLESLAQADLIIWSGRELEPLLGAALAQLAKQQNRVFEILSSEELKVLPARGNDNSRDAWFWLDTRNMLILLDEITRLLVTLDPPHAHDYERNRARILEPLIQIDREMEVDYKNVSGIPVFFYHDTHHYFEQAYAMKVAGVVASPPAAPSNAAAGLLALKSWLENAPGNCLFTETTLAEPHLDLLLGDRDVVVVELDSLGGTLQPGPELYLSLMKKNFNAISTCVRTVRGERNSTAAGRDRPLDGDAPLRIRPAYALMTQYGEAVTHEDFPGRLQLISFGYTYCPDICPTSLSVVSRVMELLGDAADKIQPIFITVDPHRDTPEVLKRYAAYFHPSLLGLSGTPESTRRIADNFKVRYEKVMSTSGDPSRYSMDHTASLYLLGTQAEFITKFPYGTPAEQIAARLRGLLAN